MKLRKVIFSSAFVIAIACCFAFKAQEYIPATYVDVYNQFACDDGITDDSCTALNTGPQCTTWDPASESYQPAYEYQGPGEGGNNCTYPLYSIGH